MINDLTLKTKAGFFGFGDAPPSITDTNPLLAYSLRDLYGTGGVVIRLRRSSDNTVADFTASELTESNIDSWTSSGTAHIEKWYQQNPSYDMDMQQTVAANQPHLKFESENEPYIDCFTSSNYGNPAKLVASVTTDVDDELKGDLSFVHTTNINSSQSFNTNLFGVGTGGNAENRNARGIVNEYVSPAGTFTMYSEIDDSGSTGVRANVTLGMTSFLSGYKTLISTGEGNANGNDARSIHYGGETTGGTDTTDLGDFGDFDWLTLNHWVVYGWQAGSAQKVTESLVYDRVLSTADKEFIDTMSAGMRY